MSRRYDDRLQRGLDVPIDAQFGDRGDDAGIEYTDVVVVGAGVSGIGAAYRLQESNPRLTYTVLDRRDRIGGTWDLFRYPGIRSDSDIFTLSFPWEPWVRAESIAQGDAIQQYLTDTAAKHGIDRHIQFGVHVHTANWDSNSDMWTLEATQDGRPRRFQCRFVFFGTGYYSYDDPYTPDFPGLGSFAGKVVHPQHWPTNLDYAGKRVVIIGSGATAISMAPALTQDAGSVTLLQRSPGYLMSQREFNPLNDIIRKVLPTQSAHTAVRWVNIFLTLMVYYFCRMAPKASRNVVRRTAVKSLPEGYDVDVHFKPSYDPWDQRFVVALDFDFYKAVSDGRIEVVTDHIERFDSHGIVLRSGRRIDADVVITATGLQLQSLGGVRLVIDGVEVKPNERWAYKSFLLSDVPNLAWCIGYVNASWTLRADMTARAFARLVAHMSANGYTRGYPTLGNEVLTEKPTFDLESGYVMRSGRQLPKSGRKRPWLVRHNFLADLVDFRFDRIEESMVFTRFGDTSTLPAWSALTYGTVQMHNHWPRSAGTRP
ncbi:NAD(P)/FAD-dependent oxidoreductase [Mycobacterium sp. 94-17]|uniref:flavin-containing monooxygenase n=1 Tax=Mycobacterium sp. 94-17 TaxID=2986147 RepID=UPI002D1E8BA2|nr:NAD(P)/FAD-dependent oxidoreductase [Mycobacterium sp. 94-17]MEB4207733.1 NAD(P)/FAD-dependent oxidoreductase [Mycobacterium sp. 94-17]